MTLIHIGLTLLFPSPDGRFLEIRHIDATGGSSTCEEFQSCRTSSIRMSRHLLWWSVMASFTHWQYFLPWCFQLGHLSQVWNRWVPFKSIVCWSCGILLPDMLGILRITIHGGNPRLNFSRTWLPKGLDSSGPNLAQAALHGGRSRLKTQISIGLSTLSTWMWVKFAHWCATWSNYGFFPNTVLRIHQTLGFLRRTCACALPPFGCLMAWSRHISAGKPSWTPINFCIFLLLWSQYAHMIYVSI